MSTNAQQTLTSARDLKASMNAAGHELSLSDAYRLARIAQAIGRETDEELRKADRWQRVQRGMVAGYCADMRACGWYDGE
jgi:hypothetical protein